MKQRLLLKLKTVAVCGGAIAIATLISAHLPFIRVSGNSMEPTYLDDEIVYLDREADSYNRGDVVIFKQKVHLPFEEKLIKRVCGIPGDEIYCDANGSYFIYDGKTIYYYESDNDSIDIDELIAKSNYQFTLTERQYFCMGDNRDYSVDSRSFGAIDESKILACVKNGFITPVKASYKGM